MAQERKEPQLLIACETCGSTDVARDAWAEWDVEAQEWVLRTVFDMAFCHECDGETNIEEREITTT